MIMLGSLQLSAPISSWSRRRCQPQQRSLRTIVTRCALLHKKSERFLTSLTIAAAGGDASATNRLIRKFVASVPKWIALNALLRLLSPSKTPHSKFSFLALPLYSGISKAPWFSWDPEMLARLIALLAKKGLHDESQILISDAVSRAELKEQDLAEFYCKLIEFQAKHKCRRGFKDSCRRLTQFLHNCKTDDVKRQASESLVGGLCKMRQPRKAETLIEEMRVNGLEPSESQLKYLVYGYGRLGQFGDMLRSVQKMEAEGFAMDTVCANMVLSAYGARKDLAKVVIWLQKMKTLAIPFSAQTYDTVLNSCPLIMSLLQDPENLPVSMEELMKSLDPDEVLVLKELIGSSVLECAMEWGPAEVKLDLHGMHLGAAYLIILQWMEEMRQRLNGDDVMPTQITVVSGWGYHSVVRGKSSMKNMVRQLMIRTGSPMRIDDRKNIGCFIAQRTAVKKWLCS